MSTTLVPEVQTKLPLKPPRVRRQIRKGIKWLDERVPEWELRVEPAKINLLDDKRCILGQVFGHFLISGNHGLSTRKFLMYGFMPFRTAVYENEWREYVSYRRAELLASPARSYPKGKGY